MEQLLASSYERVAPLEWPHGLINISRSFFLLLLWLARFFHLFCAALPISFVGQLFVLLIFGALATEAVHTWLRILQRGELWTKSLLFYPLLILIMLANTFYCISLINDYRLIASTYTNVGWPLFWVSIQMICSLAVLSLCLIHLFVGGTHLLLLNEYRIFWEVTSEGVRDHINLRREGYEEV